MDRSSLAVGPGQGPGCAPGSLPADRGQDRSALSPAGLRSAQAEAEIHDPGAGAGRAGAFSRVPGHPLTWMREATLLALPSRHEGLPTVLIEALDCGTQIVATDCPGGLAEIQEDGKYGQFVPVEDHTTLAQTMLSNLNGTFHVPSETITRPGPKISPLKMPKSSIWKHCLAKYSPHLYTSRLTRYARYVKMFFFSAAKTALSASPPKYSRPEPRISL